MIPSSFFRNSLRALAVALSLAVAAPSAFATTPEENDEGVEAPASEEEAAPPAPEVKKPKKRTAKAAHAKKVKSSKAQKASKDKAKGKGKGKGKASAVAANDKKKPKKDKARPKKDADLRSKDHEESEVAATPRKKDEIALSKPSKSGSRDKVETTAQNNGKSTKRLRKKVRRHRTEDE